MQSPPSRLCRCCMIAQHRQRCLTAKDSVVDKANCNISHEAMHPCTLVDHHTACMTFRRAAFLLLATVRGIGMYRQDGTTELAHCRLKLLGMLLIYLPKAGFMCLPLLPLCILHAVFDFISQRTRIALQQQVVSC